MNDKAPAGWYDHPTMANTRRYWDGERWTDQIIEKAAAPAEAGPSAPSAKADRTGRWKSPKVIVPIVAVVLVAAGLGLYFGLKGGDTFTVSGAMTLDSPDGYSGTGKHCQGSGGYSDLAEGTQVTIRNNSGKTIAVGQLALSEAASGACIFGFSIDDVPVDGDLYSIEIAHRGEVSFKRSEASHVSLSIGDGS